METLDVRSARRLALARAGLLRPGWTDLPSRTRGKGESARGAALRIVDRFGYLQLDTVSIAGARSHSIVLLSRLAGCNPELGESLLAPDAALFEYWGHEASWLPIELYPTFAFRRRALREHPRWGGALREHETAARALRRRIREEGPLRSVDLEGEGSRGWWRFKHARWVAHALWSCGELAIRERRGFQRSYDLPERVIPERWRRARPPSRLAAIETLLLRALDGHGWASPGTLAQTWRLRNCGPEIRRALERLRERGDALPCVLHEPSERDVAGWVRPRDLELAERLSRARPREDDGVLLSPFDPVLWERPRVARLFGFDQVLEIFKPKGQRRYGYYCLPVLAGDRLVARFDLKAERRAGRLQVLSYRPEPSAGRSGSADRKAAAHALARYSESLALRPTGWRAPR